MLRFLSLLGLSISLQACAAIPAGSDVESHADLRHKYADRLSVDNIKQDREQIYAQKLAALKILSPIQDAQRAVAADGYYFLAYQTGRGGLLKTPGLTQQQSSNKRCGIQMLDGMGDVIYGDNHLQYRKAIRDYAYQFNKTMFSFCR